MLKAHRQKWITTNALFRCLLFQKSKCSIGRGNLKVVWFSSAPTNDAFELALPSSHPLHIQCLSASTEYTETFSSQLEPYNVPGVGSYRDKPFPHSWLSAVGETWNAEVVGLACENNQLIAMQGPRPSNITLHEEWTWLKCHQVTSVGHNHCTMEMGW